LVITTSSLALKVLILRDHVSESAKDFIRKLLLMDPSARMTSSQVFYEINIEIVITWLKGPQP
jgi:hypothetical protein